MKRCNYYNCSSGDVIELIGDDISCDLDCLNCPYVSDGEGVPIGDYYKGYIGALRFISDISYDYDNQKTIEGLKSLVDEIRSESLKALELGEKYNSFLNKG